MNTVTVEKYSIQHSPTLNTLLMIENVLEKQKNTASIAELKEKLPRKVMHSTLMQSLDYLQESGKILLTTKGIVWIFAPREEIIALRKRGRAL